MPIKVTCQCGKSFAAKDALAGKVVKCPNCQQALRIPGAAAAPAKPARPGGQAAAKPAPKPAKPAPKPASPSSSGIGIGEEDRGYGLSDSALSEVGLTKQALNTRPCPGCTAPLAPDAVICIKCGFNTNLGRRMETIKVGGQTGPVGHGAIVSDLMDRAAYSIEDQKAEDRRKTGEGVPWWGYLLGLFAVVGFMVMMMFMPPQMALTIGAIVLYGAAICINFYASIRILIVAFTESMVQGLLCLLVPCYSLVYVITRWDQCGTYFLMSLASSFIANAAWFGVKALIGVMGNGEAQSALLLDPPAIVGQLNGSASLISEPLLQPIIRKVVPSAKESSSLVACDGGVADACRIGQRVDEARAAAARRSASWRAAA